MFEHIIELESKSLSVSLFSMSHLLERGYKCEDIILCVNGGAYEFGKP